MGFCVPQQRKMQHQIMIQLRFVTPERGVGRNSCDTDAKVQHTLTTALHSIFSQNSPGLHPEFFFLGHKHP